MSIRQLIKNPEGKTLEFKRDLSSPRPILRTVLAFANTAGGRLIVGVDNARSVIGVEHPLNEEEKICNLIEQWGSGVRRIFKEAEELGLPEMQIVEIGMRLRFIVPLARQLKIPIVQEPGPSQMPFLAH